MPNERVLLLVDERCLVFDRIPTVNKCIKRTVTTSLYTELTGFEFPETVCLALVILRATSYLLFCSCKYQSLHFDLAAETGSSIDPLAWAGLLATLARQNTSPRSLDISCRTDSNKKQHEPDSHFSLCLLPVGKCSTHLLLFFKFPSIQAKRTNSRANECSATALQEQSPNIFVVPAQHTFRSIIALHSARKRRVVLKLLCSHAVIYISDT